MAMAQAGTEAQIFRLGTFDRSSAEFHQGVPTQPGNFVVGRSSAMEDWYATQPPASITASATSSANSASAPRTIQFPIEHTPLPAYQLHVAVLIETPGVPALEISVNGKHGRFYLHPELDPGLGDPDSAFDPAYSHADVVFTFPGNYLHQGLNTIALQAIEEGNDPAPNAVLTYDAVELDGEAGAGRQVSTAQILPTVFYQQQQGQLKEIVDAFLRYDEKPTPGSAVDLSIGESHYHQTIKREQDFGEEKIEFAVAEFPAATRARLSWTAGGRLQHQAQSIDPARKWTLYLTPLAHLDMGFTDYQPKIASIQSRIIDEAMDMAAKHPDFRYNIDGEWNLEQFMKTRTPVEQQRAITAIQKHEIFVPAQYANLLTGFPTAETLIRSLYASANFSREHGTSFDYANMTDVPSYSWSYASVLASAGIKYFLAGSNNHRAPVLRQGSLHEQSPFYWEGPDGKKVLFWYSRSYSGMQRLFGTPPHLSAGYDMVPLFLQMYKRPSYRADAAILYGSQGDNTDLYPQHAELAKKWNSIYAYPRLQYSSFPDALKNVARQFGNDISTVRGDGGPYWELGIGSDAYYAALERNNESRAPSAEKLATLTSLVNPRLAADKTDLDRMWTDMVLMDEHTWDSNDSVTDPTSTEAVRQLAFKDSFAVKAKALADFVTRNSMASVADSISAGSGSLIVFNTLNWTRDGVVSLDIDNGNEIVDRSTGKVIPFEVLRDGNMFRHVRFTAQNVPAVGYKVFELRKAAQPAPSPEAPQSTVLENSYYRVELDPESGAVRSIYDKQLQHELVNRQSPYRFGQYLYVTGGDRKPDGVMLHSWYRPKPELEIVPAHGGRLLSITRTPDGCVAHLQSTDTNTPAIASEIRLFDHEKKIEFVEDVNKKDVTSDESVYFAFPFAMDHPRFQYEIQTGVVDPARDMYPGAGHEWFSVQHWASVEQNGISATVMPLDVPLMTFGDINREAWPTQFGDRPGTIFSYAMNNYWEVNYRAGQGGLFHFRYVITSAPSTNAPVLSRMGWEEMTPLEADQVTARDKAVDLPRTLSGTQDSFLEVKDKDLLLQTWKPAEDGNGTILRFLDLGGTGRAVVVHLPLFSPKEVWQTDAVERDQKQLPLTDNRDFTLNIHPHEIVTVRIISMTTGTKAAAAAP